MRERWRYIAFRIEGDSPFARNDFLNSFLHSTRGSAVHDGFRVTVFEGYFGILKVRHTLKDDAIKALSELASIKDRPCKVIPLKTSGTIKTLKEKYSGEISSREGTSQE